MTPLLSNAVLSRLERMRINATRRFTNASRGENLAGRGGASIEFADYRNYVAGDDVRYVDWNAFARLNRPYLKIYRREEELHVVILVDASSSMDFEGKLTMARSLAAAFGMMGLLGTERVSVYTFNEPGATPGMLRPCRGRASLMSLFAFLEGVEGGGESLIDTDIEGFLRHHIGRGVAVVLSDFLTTGDMPRAFNQLYSSGLEIFACQILGPSELDPELVEDARFIDCETTQVLDVSASSDLLALYHEYRRAYEANLSLLCRQRCGRFLTVSAADPLDWVLFDFFRRKGWLV